MRLALGVVAAALVVAASGCGGDGDGDEDAARSNPGVAVTRTVETETTTEAVQTRPEPASTQSRWAAGVDDACLPLQQRLDALPQPTDAATLQAWLGQAIPIVREQIAAVK
ncbi:MAG TPA: hypothetical protein VF044_02125, partial [Actinomycetota bacterium]